MKNESQEDVAHQGSSFDRKDSIDKTRKAIREVDRAEQALETLTKAGVNEGAILRGVFSYCGPIPQPRTRTKGNKNDVGLHEARLFNDRVGVLADKLGKLADEFEEIVQGLPRFSPGWEIHSRLSIHMREHAQLLKARYKGFRSGRPARSGRNHHLFYLVQLVRIVTGDEHYNELAELSNAVRDDPQGGKSPKSLSEIVTRFAEDLFMAAVLKEQAQEEVAEWKLTLPNNSEPSPVDRR
jgi:hypothetical protein